MTIFTGEKVCLAVRLRLVPYADALKMQEELVRARTEGKIGDVLLILQHPAVVTVGRFRGDEDVLVFPEVLSREGIELFHTSRGGSVTYHGPGQLVGYPIISLKENRLKVREYIWKLEEVIIGLLRSFDIWGRRAADFLPG